MMNEAITMMICYCLFQHAVRALHLDAGLLTFFCCLIDKSRICCVSSSFSYLVPMLRPNSHPEKSRRVVAVPRGGYGKVWSHVMKVASLAKGFVITKVIISILPHTHYIVL